MPNIMDIKQNFLPIDPNKQPTQEPTRPRGLDSPTTVPSVMPVEILSHSPSINPPQHSSSLHKGLRMRTPLLPLTPLRLAGLRPLSQRLQAQQIRSLRISEAMTTSRRQTTATMLPGLPMSKARV